MVVVNLAHLVYDFGGFSARLRAFAPCLGERLDDAFEPTLGTDIFLANQARPPPLHPRRHPRAAAPLHPTSAPLLRTPAPLRPALHRCSAPTPCTPAHVHTAAA